MSQTDEERLVLFLEARISEFEKRMKKAEQTGTGSYNRLRRGSKAATQQMEEDMVRSSTRINQALASVSAKVGSFAKVFAGGFIAGGAIAALDGMASSARATVNEIASLGDEARRSGLAVEAFQEWKFVAEQNRIALDAVTDGFKELNLRADEWIKTGSGSAAEAFQRLGFTSSELAEKLKDPSALMLEIVGRLESMDKAAQIRIADEVFGGQGGERFVELLAQGEDGLKRTIDRAHEVGAVMDEDMIGKAAELDRKFAELETRMASIWKSGVIEAGYFFGLIEREREKMRYSAEEAARVAGQDLADALSNLPEVPQAALEQIEGLKVEYADLANEARNLVPALSDASNMMRGLGKEAEALMLTDLATRIGDAARAFEDGTMTGEEYAAQLREIVTETQNTISEMDALDQARLGNVIDQVSSLLDWITQLPGAAAAAREEINKLSMMDTGTPLTGSGEDLLPPSPLAPKSSQRPRGRPMDLGVPDPARSGGGRGGGGGGSSKLDSLLAELQTEREVLEEWYQESLDLLNSATDQQLEALGGRHAAMERLETEHQERMKGIQEVAQAGSIESLLGAGAEMLGALGSVNKKALRISQAFAAAEAWVSTLKGAAKELEKGVFGFKTAAMVIAKGAAFAAAIKGVSESGGSKSVGGGGSTTTTTQEAQGPIPILVSAQGIDPKKFYSGQLIIDLATEITKEFKNRGIVFK